MDFDNAYNVHCSLRLISGREIILDRITLSRTYAGLLEGTPNERSNDLSIKWAMDRVRRDAPQGQLHLIEPERRDYFRHPGDMQSVLDRQQERPLELKHIPEWLPQIECVAEFHSIGPVRDSTKDASSLTILWYQNDFGLDEVSIERLRNVDWDQHATDWEY